MNTDKNPNFSNLKYLLVFTDGGARGNPGPAACACVVKDTAGKVRLIRGKYLGKTTNNIAEYQGVMLAYTEITNLPDTSLSKLTLNFNLDSKLAVNQLNGYFKIKDENIRQFVVRIREYESRFKRITYKYIPREQNTLADGVVNQTLDKYLHKA